MMVTGIAFDVSEAVLALGMQCIAFTLEGLHNHESDSTFEDLKSQILTDVRSRLTPEEMAADPLLQGFRRLHDAVARSNKKYVASPESLRRLLLQTSQFPHINLLVDIYNLVSLKSRLSLGAHDLSAIYGNVHLRLTTGREQFQPLGTDTIKPVEPGEYAYVDDQDHILCRLEVRQSAKTKITLDTTRCLCIVQGNAATDLTYLTSVTKELISLLKKYCGGEESILYPPNIRS